MPGTARVGPALVFFAAVVVRVILILHGEWQDRTMLVKYTDIDYEVFTDAARFVVDGESPYLRATYRYTPLLAFLVAPNVFFNKMWGKFLFAGCDILIGILLYKIFSLIPSVRNRTNNQTSKEGKAKGKGKTKKNNESTKSIIARFMEYIGSSEGYNLLLTCIWLFNPFAIVVSTRGNAESIIGVLVVATIYLLFTNNLFWASVTYGLAVHFKIYPIIYALPILFYLTTPTKKRAKYSSWFSSMVYGLLSFCNRKRIFFGLISGGTFFIVTGWMYLLYGHTFLHESYLYHVTRTDHRHNFSVYFYQLYLSGTRVTSTTTTTATTTDATFAIGKDVVVGLLAFLPQVVLLVAYAYRYCFQNRPTPSGLTFCMFLQTLTFVIFNKVCTVQYFVWYFPLLPFVIRDTTIGLLQWIFIAVLWIVSQALWLSQAYYLEFEGTNTFVSIWIAGLGFFVVNILILIQVIRKKK